MRYKIAIINGPNLHLLGLREKNIYGKTTLANIEAECRFLAKTLEVDLTFFQSNHEGVLVEHIGQEGLQSDFIIINPAAYTHTSVAIRDALLAVGKPVVEVHLSNIYRREPFRHHSYISDVALGQITGLGTMGYLLAMQAAVGHLTKSGE